MGQPWKCRIGWHKWAVQFADDGSRYRECARCRKFDDFTQAPPGTGYVAGLGGGV